MFRSDLPFSKTDLLDLLTEEKEAWASYSRLCLKYKIEPDLVAEAVSETKIELLTRLIEGRVNPLGR